VQKSTESPRNRGQGGVSLALGDRSVEFCPGRARPSERSAELLSFSNLSV